MNPIQRKANSVEMNNNDHRGAKGGLRRLRRPRLLAYAAAAIGVAFVIPMAAGATGGKSSLAAPTGLQTFELRKGDRPLSTGRGQTATFSRTPSFAWNPARGATHYEFELSTSDNFRAENALIWSSKTLTTPAAAVPISLPWITGPSLYWHVRALGSGGAVSRWSNPARFDMGWSDKTLGVPQWQPNEPGYVKWTPIAGATSYQVWYGNLGTDNRDGHTVTVGKVFSTITTVADEREYVTGRNTGRDVMWRVRAVRQVYGTTRNGLPRTSFGPWSAVYQAQAGEAQAATARAMPLRTVSSDTVLTPATLGSKSVGVISDANSARKHFNMPVFVWSRDGFAYHRVYVATDKDCTNIVFTGSVVGGTAWAPRTSGPLALSGNQWDPTHSYLLDGDEGKVLSSDGGAVTSIEVIGNSSDKSGSASSTPSKSEGPAHVDLWDNDWPTGGYYWTVVPVVSGGSGSFQDLGLAQDACQAGPDSGLMSELVLKKASTDPELADGLAPYVTGLSPNGRLLSAVNRRSSFYGVPLVAWKPASGAVAYDIQWSHTSYPWRTAGSLSTYATSAMLPLEPGTWWYRVRGINPHINGNTKMSWSAPLRLTIAKPTFSVTGG